jgi:hypothetical protein
MQKERYSPSSKLLKGWADGRTRPLPPIIPHGCSCAYNSCDYSPEAGCEMGEVVEFVE